jgi:hypothetical protein
MLAKVPLAGLSFVARLGEAGLSRAARVARRRGAASGRVLGGHDPWPEPRHAAGPDDPGGLGAGGHERRPHLDLRAGPPRPACPRGSLTGTDGVGAGLHVAGRET